MARTRGGHVGRRGRGHRSGRGRGRGRGHIIQDNRAELVELVNISTRGPAFPRASPPSLASVGNNRNRMRNAQMDSQQDNSTSVVPIMLFENVPKRARNNYQPP